MVADSSSFQADKSIVGEVSQSMLSPLDIKALLKTDAISELSQIKFDIL